LTAWSSEREWRIISEIERFKFNKDSLVEIVLGINASLRTMNSANISKFILKGNRIARINRFGDEIDDNYELVNNPELLF
jgi:hypothetical protein